MGFLDWLGFAPLNVRSDAPLPSDPPAILPPPRNTQRRGATVDEAFGLSAVYRAIELRATALKQLSIDVERRGQMIDAPLFIRRPDVGTPLQVFVEQNSVSLDTHGNAYWRIRRGGDDQVQSLEVLNPYDVTIDTTPEGRVTGYKHRGATLTPDQVHHLARLRVPGTPYGLGPIQADRYALRGAIDTAKQASTYFESGDYVSGVLKSDQHLTAADAQAARDKWEETRGGRSGVAVLGNGLTYSQTYINARDAQWIESRQFDVTAVARMFGIPPSLLATAVSGTSLSYSNVINEWMSFIRWGLMGVVTEIETAFSELLPRGQRARFNTEALLRPDTRSRYEAHEIALRSGWLLPSEVRDIEGYDPVAGIDDRTVNPSARQEPTDG
jgi:HK97 family phage portal protein